MVATGDLVEVSGTVREVRPGCDFCSPADEAFANLTTTELVATVVTVVGHVGEPPEPTAIGSSPGARRAPSIVIEDDTTGDVERDEASFDPEQDGLDFYESLEGMRVRVDDARAVGPTVHFSGRAAEVVVVANRGSGFGPSTLRGGLLRWQGDDNPERMVVSDSSNARLPDLDVGDAFAGPIVGVVDYSFGNYKLVPAGLLPGLAPSLADPAGEFPPSSPHELTVATLNVQNLSPGSAPMKFDRLAELIVQNLAAPDVVVLEEIQDSSGPLDDGTTDACVTYAILLDAISRRGGPVYSARDIPPSDGQDGGAPGGNIRVGFLIRQDRGVALVDHPGAGSDSPNVVHDVDGAPELGFSPGRVEPASDAFRESRKPVAVEVDFEGSRVFLVGVHFNSQIGDLPIFGRFQPPDRPTRRQRTAQAGIVAAFVERILNIDASAHVLVAGDFNDAPSSAPLRRLEQTGLQNLLDVLPLSQRYTNIFQGNSEAIDHLLATRALAEYMVRLEVVHANVDFAHGVTDHDPIVARFAMRPRAASRGDGCACGLSRTRSLGQGFPPTLLFLIVVLARKTRRSAITASVLGIGRSRSADLAPTQRNLRRGRRNSPSSARVAATPDHPRSAETRNAPVRSV